MRDLTALTRRGRLGCVVVLAILTLASVSPGRESEPWLRVSGDGITVLYRSEDARSAQGVLRIATAAGAPIYRRMAADAPPHLEILIASSDEEFREVTSYGVPDWGVGCAFPSRNLVVIKSPRVVTYPTDIERVIAHEIAHIAAGRVLGDVRVPRWFHEGVAMAAAGEWRLAQSAPLAAGVARGTLISLADLERSFPTGAREARLAYAESFHAVRFLMDEAGAADPGVILRAMAEAESFDGGLEAVYGAGRSSFEEDVRRFFRRRFGWGHFVNAPGVFFALVTLLFLVVLVLRLRRSRRMLRAWEEEEACGTRDLKSERPSSWE